VKRSGLVVLARKLKYYAYRVAPRPAAALHRLLRSRRVSAASGPAAPPEVRAALLLEQARLLRERASGVERPDALLDLVFGFPGVAPSQNRSEILALLSAVARLRPRVICEIGSAGGGTLFLFAHVAHPEARLLSIDVGTDAEREARFRLLGREGQQLTVLGADSHDPATVERFRSWLGGGSLDFLFIDGDHSLEGVAADYETYGPSVRPGGIVAFHDIVPDFDSRYGVATGTYAGGVPEFWSRLRGEARGRVEEFVEHRLQDGCGIGMLRQPGGDG
jgi:predicted O-methyltransferase YrrM